MSRPTIYAVDFDGTLVENDFPDIGEPKEDVIEYVREKKREGAVIIIWTTRQNEFLNKALNFCKEHDIPIDYANENVPWLEFETSRKIFADIYIDDRAVNLNGEATGKVNLSTDKESIEKQEG